MIDITRSLGAHTAEWPGDTPFSLDWTQHLWRGDNVSVSRIVLSPHIGTHADAPAHVQSGGATSGEFDLAAFIGPVLVIDARGSDLVSTEVMKDRGAIGRTRVLVRSLEVVRSEEFCEDFPPLAAEAAEALVNAGLVLYGTDAPSVDPMDSASMDAHRALGAGGVPILENLDLTRAESGDYDLLALPMKLEGAEASPVRAILLPSGALTGQE
jgi:arylformamidase